MEVKGSHTYHAPVDRVLAMLADSNAVVSKFEAMGHHDVEVLECARDGSVVRVRSSRIVDVELPSFAKKVLKPTNTMVQTDEWHEAPSGGWEGTFTVAFKGAPVHIDGTMRLTPANGDCMHDVTMSVTVKVPLIGNRIAEWAADHDVRRSLDGEFDFGDRWLAEH